MNRRNFLLGAAGAGTLGASTAIAQTGLTVSWRLASSFPPTLDTIFGGAEVFAQTVADLTGGRFVIRVFPAGALAPGLQVLDSVRDGTVECGHTAGYYYVGKDLSFGFDTAIPFGLSQRQQNAWMQFGGGLELMRELYGQHNVVNFPAGNTGAQMGGWFHREINTVADLRGLKMRIPGLGGQVMRRLGAEPVNLPGGEIFQALKDRKVDAAEWVGPYDDEKLNLQAVSTYYYYPAWWEPSTMLTVLVNKQAYDALPPTYKAVVAAAAATTNEWMMAAYDARNPQAYKRIVSRSSNVRLFSDALMIAAYQEAFRIYDEEAAKNPFFKRVFTNWRKFRVDANYWHMTAELAMSNFTARWR